jgi:hypothetical protein
LTSQIKPKEKRNGIVSLLCLVSFLLYVEDFISEMNEREHMILTFNNEIQFKEIVNAFIKRGINYNQINILLIYRKEEQKYLRTLDKILNINSLFNSQEITIIPADDGFHNDSFFVEPIIKNLLSIMSLAKQRLNVLGTLSGKLVEQGTPLMKR